MSEKVVKVGLFGARSGGSGLGRFASEIKDALDSDSSFEVILPTSETTLERFDVAVYVNRSDSQLEQAISTCGAGAVPLLILSTGLGDAVEDLQPKCEVVFVPNSSSEVRKYMADVVDFSVSHPDWQVSITEYHQPSKSDVSGTALEIARQIGSEYSRIISIRDDARVMQEFNLRGDELASYAIHQITFTDPRGGAPRLFEMKVVGRGTYVSGLLKMLKNNESHK